MTRFDERFQSLASGLGFSDGALFGRWRVVFDGRRPGFGVAVVGHHLQLSPERVSSPMQTRASLVVSRRSFDVDALHVTSTWATLRQHRLDRPNPWEVGWLVWDFTGPEDFTYLALKPNGWEIGRRDPRQPGGQRFIATGDDITTPIGVARTATIDRIGTQTTVRVDDTILATFFVDEDETTGSVGMYTEDALAEWRRMFVATS